MCRLESSVQGCQARAKPPSWAHRVAQAVPASPELPMAGRRETRSTLHTSPTAAATECSNVMGLSWCGEKDSLCLRNSPEYNSLKNNKQRKDLRKPATFQLMTVFAGSAKKEQLLLLPRE